MTCTIISSKAELQLECKNENEQPYHGIKLELYQIIMQLYQKRYDPILEKHSTYHFLCQ